MPRTPAVVPGVYTMVPVVAGEASGDTATTLSALTLPCTSTYSVEVAATYVIEAAAPGHGVTLAHSAVVDCLVSAPLAPDGALIST